MAQDVVDQGGVDVGGVAHRPCRGMVRRGMGCGRIQLTTESGLGSSQPHKQKENTETPKAPQWAIFYSIHSILC